VKPSSAHRVAITHVLSDRSLEGCEAHRC